MNRKKLTTLISCLMTGMIVTTLINPSTVFAEEITQSGQVSTNTENKSVIKAKDRVSVHDPSIVKDGNSYYIFGSHIEGAKSTDLINWTKFTNSYAHLIM